MGRGLGRGAAWEQQGGARPLYTESSSVQHKPRDRCRCPASEMQGHARRRSRAAVRVEGECPREGSAWPEWALTRQLSVLALPRPGRSRAPREGGRSGTPACPPARLPGLLQAPACGALVLVLGLQRARGLHVCLPELLFQPLLTLDLAAGQAHGAPGPG